MIIQNEDGERQQGTETRHRILDAAERLFAEKGFEGTSIRDITSEAGCNLAAVNYHFGSKIKLYRSVFSRMHKELSDWRRQMIIGDIEAAGSGASLELFLESFARAFFRPFAGGERGRRLESLMDREIRAHRLTPELFLHEVVEPIRELAHESIERTMPRMDPMSIDRCIMSLMAELIHTRMMQVKFGRQGKRGPLSGDLESQIRHIVHYAAGGFRACSHDVNSSGTDEETGGERAEE